MWCWLFEVQQSDEFCEHASFREFLGMPPYDSSILVPSMMNGIVLKDAVERESPKSFTGTTLRNFRFLDLNPMYKLMFRSCKDTHGLTVRGRDYLNDQVKVSYRVLLISYVCRSILGVQWLTYY